MKISLIVTMLLGLSAVASHYWEEFWFMFKYESVVTKDCGQSWTLIGFDESVPSDDGNPCYIKETVPKSSLEGNTISFVGLLAPKAELQIHISYQYEIMDPPKYMKALSSVARQVAARGDFEANASVWDSAKSLVIDAVVLDVASSPDVLQANGIGDVSQYGLDELVIKKSNERLAEWGLRLTSVMSS